MKHDDSKRIKIPRRSVIGMAGMAMLSGIWSAAQAQSPIRHEESAGNEKVRLITSSGELVEVERRHLPKGQETVQATNDQVMDWMRSDR